MAKPQRCLTDITDGEGQSFPRDPNCPSKIDCVQPTLLDIDGNVLAKNDEIVRAILDREGNPYPTDGSGNQVIPKPRVCCTQYEVPATVMDQDGPDDVCFEQVTYERKYENSVLTVEMSFQGTVRGEVNQDDVTGEPDDPNVGTLYEWRAYGSVDSTEKIIALNNRNDTEIPTTPNQFIDSFGYSSGGSTSFCVEEGGDDVELKLGGRWTLRPRYSSVGSEELSSYNASVNNRATCITVTEYEVC